MGFYQTNMYNTCRSEKNIDFILFICHNGLEYYCQGLMNDGSEEKSNGKKMEAVLSLADDQELYLLKTMDNPVNQIRSSILIRSHCANPTYQMVLKVND